MTSASQRYAARRLAINRGFGRPPDRVAPVVAIADNGQDDSADGIPARIRTGSHHVARRAYHHSNGFDVLFRTVSVVGKNGSVPLQAAARNRSAPDLPRRRPFRDRHRRRFEPVNGVRWLPATHSTSSTIFGDRPQRVNKTRHKRFVKVPQLA